MGLPIKAEIPRIWDTVVPQIGGTCTDIVCSFSPRYGSEEPVSIAECYASTFGSIDRPEGPVYGSRSGIRLTSWDFEEQGAFLRYYTTG